METAPEDDQCIHVSAWRLVSLYLRDVCDHCVSRLCVYWLVKWPAVCRGGLQGPCCNAPVRQLEILATNKAADFQRRQFPQQSARADKDDIVAYLPM